MGAAQLALFLGSALPLGRSPLSDVYVNQGWREFLHRRRAFTSQTGGISRSDRQVRYYREQGARARGQHNTPLRPKKTGVIGRKRDQPLQTYPERTKRHSSEWRFAFPVLVTGLPANYGRWYIPPYLSQAPPTGLPSVWDRFARMLLSDCRFFVGSPEISSSRYITGTLVIAIVVPFLPPFRFSQLQQHDRKIGLHSRSCTPGFCEKP